MTDDTQEKSQDGAPQDEQTQGTPDDTGGDTGGGTGDTGGGGFPSPDLDAVMITQQKNIEALTKANEKATSGLQKVIDTQTQGLAQSMTQLQTVLQSAIAMASPQTAPAMKAQMKAGLKAFQTSVDTMNKSALSSAQEGAAAYKSINEEVQKNLEELKKATQKMVDQAGKDG